MAFSYENSSYGGDDGMMYASVVSQVEPLSWHLMYGVRMGDAPLPAEVAWPLSGRVAASADCRRTASARQEAAR